MSAKKTLGRGLDTLLPKDFDNSLLLPNEERVQKLFITDIEPNPEQPRREFDKTSLEELASSITKYGILQPVIVSPEGDKYRLVAGERRWRAAQLAGLNTMPAIVRERVELEQLEIALIENVQRVDLSPLEQALSIARLHEQFNLSYKEIADKLGKATPTVNNIVRLLHLPGIAREALRDGHISEGHARAILALKDSPADQQRLLELIRNQGWSVRQAEQYVNAHKQGLKPKATTKRTAKETPESKRLSGKLGTKVTVYHTAKGGRLEIHFKDDNELSELYKKLG